MAKAAGNSCPHPSTATAPAVDCTTCAGATDESLHTPARISQILIDQYFGQFSSRAIGDGPTATKVLVLKG